MRKLSEVFDSNHKLLEDLAYSKGHYEGESYAKDAKRRLQEELNLVEPILESIDLEYGTKQHIEFEIKKLKICLENLKPSRSTNDQPLNIVLREYFCDRRKQLQEYFSELGI